MIKANELRIGNYVKLKNSDTTLVPRDFQRYCNHFGIFEEFEPIKLTEEWLLKAGFENNSTYEFSKDTFNLTGDIRAFYFSLPFQNGVTLKYVHQLQNLYFALTGKELEFSI